MKRLTSEETGTLPKNCFDCEGYGKCDGVAECATYVGSVLCKIENIIGQTYDLDRLRELVEADREGRALLPPVKVDDPIYLIVRTTCPRKPSTYHVEEYHVDHITFGCSGKPMISACSGDNEWVELISGSRVGKEYFLTREKAEAALKKLMEE